MKAEQLSMTGGFEKVMRLPDELSNSIKLDEELTGFRWDNPTYRKTLSLYDKYQREADAKADNVS
jgi:hypothetical protein